MLSTKKPEGRHIETCPVGHLRVRRGGLGSKSGGLWRKLFPTRQERTCSMMASTHGSTNARIWECAEGSPEEALERPEAYLEKSFFDHRRQSTVMLDCPLYTPAVVRNPAYEGWRAPIFLAALKRH